MEFKQPLVTVFMAVYNGERYIADAISSILRQTLTNFELLLINDGSTDTSVQIAESFKDNRIRILHNETNLGLHKTRNRGIREAKGVFFATQDCDDIAFPHRLEVQVKVMLNHPEYAVCGARAIMIDEDSLVSGKILLPVGQKILPSYLFFSNCFINSATIIKTDVLREMEYRPGFEPAEDYDLFVRISRKYKIVNINIPVIYYRIHHQNATHRKANDRKNGDIKIIEYQLNDFGMPVTEINLAMHYLFITKNFRETGYLQEEVEQYLLKLKQINRKNGRYDRTSFEPVLLWQWTIATASAKLLPSSILKYVRSDLFKLKYLNSRLLEHFVEKLKSRVVKKRRVVL